jgi:serine/threonine protein kinase
VTGEPHLIRRFESEMQTFSRLEHPHLAPVFDFWREPDRAFVVTPFYRGGALESALVDRSWGLSATVKLADQLADALLSPSTGVDPWCVGAACSAPGRRWRGRHTHGR